MKHSAARLVRLSAILLLPALAAGCLSIDATKQKVTVQMPSPPPGSPEAAPAVSPPPETHRAPLATDPKASKARVEEMLKPSSNAATIDDSCQVQCDEQGRLCARYKPGAIGDCQQAARQCRESCVR